MNMLYEKKEGRVVKVREALWIWWYLGLGLGNEVRVNILCEFELCLFLARLERFYLGRSNLKIDEKLSVFCMIFEMIIWEIFFSKVLKGDPSPYKVLKVFWPEKFQVSHESHRREPFEQLYFGILFFFNVKSQDWMNFLYLNLIEKLTDEDFFWRLINLNSNFLALKKFEMVKSEMRF